MKALNFGLALAFLLTGASCKKKKYPDSMVENEAAFYFNGEIDNSPVTIAAGLDGYYMYSSFTQNANNMYTFIADLKKTDCGNCGNGLLVRINDNQLSGPGAPVQISSAIVPGPLKIQAGPYYEVQFNSAFNRSAVSYLWDFGDGTQSSAANPLHVYTKRGSYQVRLTVKDSGGCTSTVSNMQKIGYPNGSRVFISESSKSGNIVQFGSVVQGAAPSSYLWSFGDGSASSQQNPLHTYAIPGSYPVTLRVLGSDSVFTVYNAITQSDASSCGANYSITTVNTVYQPVALSNITITWTDAAGTAYTSNSELQPQGSYVEVTTVESYDNNEKNEPVKKIKLKFKCNVYNGASFKVINNAEASIAVSYR
jgi:PKD repeat protein